MHSLLAQGSTNRLFLTLVPLVLAQRAGKPRYDPDTKKWSFRALSLISGVWIGTATA